MKKILAVLLVAILAVCALTACNNNTKKPDASTPSSTKEPSSPAGSTASTEAPGTPAESTVDPTPDNTTFDTRDEEVYVFNAPSGLKLRTTNNFNIDNVEHIVENGTKLKRIGVGVEDPAVSKVVYGDKEFFCGSRYLTTQAPEAPSESTAADETVVFEPVNETVYVTTGYEDGKINVYSQAYKGWSSTNKKYVINDMNFTEGMALTRTGVCNEDPNDLEVGWSRIEYNGKTYYTRNAYLKTAAPESATTAAPAESTAAPTGATAAPTETTAAPAESN